MRQWLIKSWKTWAPNIYLSEEQRLASERALMISQQSDQSSWIHTQTCPIFLPGRTLLYFCIWNVIFISLHNASFHQPRCISAPGYSPWKMFGLNKLSSISREEQERCGLRVQSHWVDKVQVYVSFLEDAPSSIYFPVLFTVWRWN